MFAHLDPAPPAQGADVIARAVGAVALATLSPCHTKPAGRPARIKR